MAVTGPFKDRARAMAVTGPFKDRARAMAVTGPFKDRGRAMAVTGPFKAQLAGIVLVVLLFGASDCSVTTSPYELAVQPGETAEFLCTFSGNTSETPTLLWSADYNITDNVQYYNSSGRFRSVNGTLTILNVTHEDAGIYRCTENANSSATVTLIVYDMPDYIVEAAIIGAICIFLFIVLATGIIIVYVNQRRERAARHKARREKYKKHGLA